MTISVIIPWSKGTPDRQEGLEILFDCIKRQTFRDFELVFVEMTRDGTLTYLPYAPDQKVVLNYPGIMNKSWVCNVGARAAKTDYLLFIDADTQFESDYFAQVWDFYDRFKNKFFLPWTECLMLPGRDEPTPRTPTASAMKAAAHAWFVEKNFYWSIGGMNEKYYGYGAEDQDFWERALHVLKDIPNMPYKLVHTYHHFHPRESAYPLNDRRVALIESTRNFLDHEIEKLVALREELGREVPCAKLK